MLKFNFKCDVYYKLCAKHLTISSTNCLKHQNSKRPLTSKIVRTLLFFLSTEVGVKFRVKVVEIQCFVQLHVLCKCSDVTERWGRKYQTCQNIIKSTVICDARVLIEKGLVEYNPEFL